jgi:hypothetical protein
MTSSLAITVAPGDEESAIPADPEGARPEWAPRDDSYTLSGIAYGAR